MANLGGWSRIAVIQLDELPELVQSHVKVKRAVDAEEDAVDVLDLPYIVQTICIYFSN